MHSSAMSVGKSRTTSPPSVKMFRLKHVRNQRECEQVAAVCYRLRTGAIEFLLVRTGSGHWTFPKGGVEPGLSHAQAAALEAFEEAGVHGRMEEASFARYVRSKGGRRRGSTKQAPDTEVSTSAHLCEVLRLVTPQESDRNPTWFTTEKAQKKLAEGRTVEFAAELVRVVDRAVARIERLSNSPMPPTDALHRVRFESGAEHGRLVAAPYSAIIESDESPRARKGAARDLHHGPVGRLGPTLVVGNMNRRAKRLSSGTLPTSRNRD